jgi:ArsR family transcriptional regulator
MLNPGDLFAILSDSTRLRALMLVQAEGEVCVCELMFALDESQPKISRHLAVMRAAGIVASRREGTWIHYRMNSRLSSWAKEVMALTHQRIQRLSPFADDRDRLQRMNNRPHRTVA